jgi:hypothetical protein
MTLDQTRVERIRATVKRRPGEYARLMDGDVEFLLDNCDRARWERGAWKQDNPHAPYPGDTQDPVVFLEESSIQWKRDWDAVLIGFVLGVLATLAAGGL